MKPVIVILAVFIIAVMILFTYGKRVQMDRLAVLLQCGEFEQFDRVVNSFLSKLLVRHYDLEYVKLNSYIVRKDKENTDRQFDFLLKLSQSAEKRNNLIVRAFEYYVYENDRIRSEEYLKEIQKNFSEEYTEYFSREFDILINRSTDYIEELELEADKYEGQRKMVTLYLLKLSFENNHNSKKAQEIENQINALKKQI